MSIQSVEELSCKLEDKIKKQQSNITVGFQENIIFSPIFSEAQEVLTKKICHSPVRRRSTLRAISAISPTESRKMIHNEGTRAAGLSFGLASAITTISSPFKNTSL